MAQKRKKRRKRAKKKNPFTTLFYILLVAGLSYFSFQNGTDYLENIQQVIAPLPKPVELNNGVEIPAVLTDRKEQVITHAGYTVSYNSDWCIPNWVAYELTAEKTKGTVKRGKDFIPDPQVKGRTATTEDYKHSGYDRGHMAPAADMKWSTYAMAQSFYLSNICPQNRNLNNGDWKMLEEKGRNWALEYESVYIVCGPLVEKGYTTVGKNKVVVPQRFFKVFFRNAGKNSPEPRGIGFIFENKADSRALAEYAVSIDFVEKESGIDFFHSLPDEVEKRIESECDPAAWGL